MLEKGGALFQQQCSACHGLAAEGFGPPLGGITLLLSESQLVEWVRDPAKVLASGNERAHALLQRYKAPMPSFAHLSADEIRSVLAYLDASSAARKLGPFKPDAAGAAPVMPRLVPPVQPSGLAVELEDYAQIPLLPGRTAYKGITLLRPDPREAGVLLVDELMGLLYRVKGRQPAVFLDVRPIFPDFMCDPGVASGLGSFALHPDFAHNGLFYTTHSEPRRGRPVINPADVPADLPPYETPPIEWVLTEWRMADPGAPVFAGTHREVLRFVTPTTGHGGQELAFAPVTDREDPDYGVLYWGLGDGGSINLKRHDLAGHPKTLLGSILRIDPAGTNAPSGQYGIPRDNPFATSSDPAVRKEIWAYGFRNAHRLSWDLGSGVPSPRGAGPGSAAPPVNRQMFAVDIGESNLEEVNIIQRGGAYGWGVGHLEGVAYLDAKIDPKLVRPATPLERAPYVAPYALYDHHDGSSITGGYVYRGPLAALRGKYIFGDMVNGRLFCLHLDGPAADRTVYELGVTRDGQPTTLKALAKVDRAHLRIGYDDRTGDLFVLTKGDGMIRRVTAVRATEPPR
ncbi:MAG TPA: PQQ-dependent sugar dehydrogenase [Lacunisphaera sp.]|nr:PQQ-dependent sugar dehydrogenase [Lacunisphaera sp.]